LPKSKGRTLETNQITATSEDSRMEVVRDQNGFHSWITTYLSPFHPSEDNLFWC
jgi:hypothetical protein